MEDEIYRLEGKFSLSDKNKMQEMNELILEILRKSGTCSLTSKMVLGRRIPVVEVAKPDKNGIIKFNYSIFEKKKRETCFYDTNTGEVYPPKLELDDYGMIILLIMAVLESYSETPCYLMKNDDLAFIGFEASIVEELTGKRLMFERRAKAFDTLAYFRQFERYKDFKFRYAYLSDYCKESDDQFYFVLILQSGDIVPESNEDTKNTWKKEAYEYFDNLKKNSELKEEALEYILKLMDMKLEERKMESSKKHPLDYISKASVYLPGAYLVSVYAKAFHMDFFTLWYEIGKEGYWDIEGAAKPNDCSSSINSKNHFHKIYKMKNDDDLIGIWNEDGMTFSETLLKDIAFYKETYLEINENNLLDYDCVSELISCENDLQTIWNIGKYLDKDMLEEFIKNKDDIRFKKAVYVLRKMINDEIEMFSELTKEQIREWILPFVNRERFANLYWHYIELLSNKTRRKELLSF